MITPHPTSQVWRITLLDLMKSGDTVSPSSAGADWRGRTTKELRAHRTVIAMNNPVVLSLVRKIGFKFLVAEAAWIASGDNRVSTIAPFSKRIASFSDDGLRFFGAYGPKFIEQLSYAVSCLVKDPASRQAVIEIWREQPRATKDVPCTLSWQYMIRDGKLECVATMRSSDIWTGWVYDVFNFSICAAIVALELRNYVDPNIVGIKGSSGVRPYAALQLGNLYLTAGSQHLYKMDEPAAMEVLTGDDAEPISPLNLDEFASGDALIEYLWALARGETVEKGWLRELFP